MMLIKMKKFKNLFQKPFLLKFFIAHRFNGGWKKRMFAMKKLLWSDINEIIFISNG